MIASVPASGRHNPLRDGGQSRPGGCGFGRFRHRNVLAAFTLLELLVVIAIFIILAGLLLPVMAKAKARASGIQCLSNSRQLTIAWQLYNDDNRGMLLFASEGSDPRTRDATWVTGTMDFQPANRSNWDPDYDLRKSPMWPYGPDTGIWKCPADTSVVRYQGRRLPRIRSVAMSLWIGGFGGDVDPWFGVGFRIYRNVSDFVDPGPSSTWLFMDQREDSINFGNFATVMFGWPLRPEEHRFYIDFPANYHHRAGGISFVDGHAEIHRWVDARTMPPLRKGTTALWAVFPSPNNRDIRWLQERATRPLK